MSELPDCVYRNRPELVRPGGPTPNHTLYLSNLDDQKFLRFSIKYLYVFRNSVAAEALKSSLARALVEFYPLAGRLRRRVAGDDRKLEVECNGEGAVFAEAAMDLSCDDFLEFAGKPNRALMRKLLYTVEATDFVDIPPLIIQVTNLRGGGMIVCSAINHCICDGIGTSQFLHAWAHIHTQQSMTSAFHSRHVLEPRRPPQVSLPHPGFSKSAGAGAGAADPNLLKFLRSQPLATSSVTFSEEQILQLKRQCYPSLKCSTFEVLASHTWRCWVRSLGVPPSLEVKLLFSMNIRGRMQAEMPQGYYGNAFVLACAEAKAGELSVRHGVKAVQRAKAAVTAEYVRSLVDLLESGHVATDLSASLVISQWSRLGLEDVDFGGGKAVHMGPLNSDIYCLFLPVPPDTHAVKVLVSMPQTVVDQFEFHMAQLDAATENGDATNHYGLHTFNMLSV